MDWFVQARSDCEPALSVDNFLGTVSSSKGLTAFFVFVTNVAFLGMAWSAYKWKNVLFWPIWRVIVKSSDPK